ncbi:hypothetical protein Sant_P0332 (plasmid) [Sodalis praecaptivus]|uniref:Uncharacterized protein n=1 Tax=Sodalis praecaptivus TaxID=1239307 RepID=W0I3R0_9GAMM|nr:hypothetical protein [Sodalis praecaptivus]AHF79367.1 hypothetical protein Sant_P0332 [Sodalis praecaptivus]
MPVESPALQNHRVGMFNNKTYRYKRKSDNIMPRVNPAAIDGNPLGEQIERLIHTRNDTPSINQTFNSNNSSMLHKVITLYALLNNTKILNTTQSSLPNGSNHTDLLSSQALAKLGEGVNITTEFAGVTLAGGGVGVLGGAKITANHTVRNDSNVNNPYRYQASADKPSLTLANEPRFAKRETRHEGRRRAEDKGAESSFGRRKRSADPVNQPKELTTRVKRALDTLSEDIGCPAGGSMNPLRTTLCTTLANIEREILLDYTPPCWERNLAQDAARAHVIVSEEPETIESDPLHSPINVDIITGVISPSSSQERVLNPDERGSGSALREDISSKTATIEDIAVAVVEEIAAGVSSLGTIALTAAEEVAAGASVIENAAVAASREIAMGAAVIEKAATATAQQIAAGAAVIGGVAAVAAGEILTQATGIDAAIAATAVELGIADIAAQEDIVEEVSDTLAQAIPDKVEIADAER